MPGLRNMVKAMKRVALSEIKDDLSKYLRLAEELPQNFGGVASGVLAQHAWNLAVFGFFATIVGAVLNWRNSRIGYWLNLGVVSSVDLGFIFAILIPGYIRLVDGLWGPALWG